MLGLLMAVEAGLARAEPALEVISASDRRHDRIAAGREAVAAEVLGFGDSLVKVGVVPAMLEARLDLRAYNLAVLAGPPPASYFLLKRALDAGARPRAVVLDSNPATLAQAPRYVVRDWAVLIGPAEALELARESCDLGLFGIYLVHHLIPSVRLRLDLRAAVVDAMAGRKSARWGGVVGRQYTVNGGALIQARSHPDDGPDPFPDGEAPPSEELGCYSAGWSALPLNLVYLGKFLRLAESRKIPVFFVVPPIHPGVQARRERLGLDEVYIDLIRKIRRKYSGVVVVDGRHAGYGHGAFADTHHLNLVGALAFSQALSESIAERLADAREEVRWVALPWYEGPPFRPVVEDVVDAFAALARRAADN